MYARNLVYYGWIKFLKPTLSFSSGRRFMQQVNYYGHQEARLNVLFSLATANIFTIGFFIFSQDMFLCELLTNNGIHKTIRNVVYLLA